MTSARPMQAPAHRKPNQQLLGLLRMCIYGVFGLILLFGLLLLILPAFRVKEIRVVGNSYYTGEQIIAAAGLRTGEELLSKDLDAAGQAILDACPYVEVVTVKSRSLSVIEITVEEKVNLMYTAFNDGYIAFDRNFRVLSQSATAEAYGDLLYVELPPIAAMSVGGSIHFAGEEMDMSYIPTLLDALCQKGLLPRVTSVDFSRKYSTSYVLDGSCRVELGRVGQLDLKFALVDRILADRTVPDSYSVVDVSSTEKPTYRSVGADEI